MTESTQPALPVDMMVCLKCLAVILRADQPSHEKWHLSLEQVAAAARSADGMTRIIGGYNP